ncbi:MAG: carbon-nitrogen hydrolase family protein [Methylococcales bacterium]|nr:carbon-nitrogen hydrolase family protein [Methylococcales bacterium]
MSTVAVIQMTSSDSVHDNLATAARLLRQAADAGAKLAALPENFAFMGLHETDKLKIKEHEGSGPIQDFLYETASRLQLWLVAGTLPMACADLHKVRAACLVYDDQGQLRARYDKIHLFDVNLPGGRESYRESTTFEQGEEWGVVDTPVGKLGLSICYDLRFPELYRKLTDQGAQLLLAPSAFTRNTGEAHWQVLLRARAIENLCYVLAPNQTGRHRNGRETYGHSAIIDPWGQVLADAGTDVGLAKATVDLNHLAEIRGAFPVLQHRRWRALQ